MFFNDVELPDELSRARDDGNLVIFAGAGVSCGPPSSLPLFPGLVQRIAKNAATSQEPKESLDGFLGRLDRNGIMVHELAQSILLNPESRPNTLHDLLLRLFGKPEAIRLVTTNFDRHFTTACQARWQNPAREYYAPALPRGSSFQGIVYLHGAAFIESKQCVLTDEDFGRAYLTEGWATQFLKDMFNCYTVLFIGYSHSDLVMNYLALGLPPSTRRCRSQDAEQ
jgi:NAD-dependent SIR2 family protein deacetylase